MRVDHSTLPAPVLQEPSIVIVAQGWKRGYLGDEVISYGPGQCLVLALPMHFGCDTVVVDDQPMLALAVKIDVAIVSELLSRMGRAERLPPVVHAPCLAVADMDSGMTGTIHRLLAALQFRQESLILGPQLVRELHYRVIAGPAGDMLCSVLARQGRLAAIYRACERISLDCAEQWNVTTMARDAAMSVSAFHRAFRAATGCSPMQYIKATRLQRAHDLIQMAEVNVAQAAHQVGYASTSQFSREFKRLFGYAPGELTHARRH